MGDKESAFREFDRMGVEHVQRWLVATQNRSAPSIVFRRELAAEWLAPFDRQSRETSEADNVESKRIARSAKNAAWAAAIAAIVATVMAAVSVVIAYRALP